MKKPITGILLACFVAMFFSNPAIGGDGWEINMKATAGNSESRLSFGQRPGATDNTDGLYDVPAMLAGSLLVYFQTDDGAFWRDIKADGEFKEWQLVVRSLNSDPVTLTWDSGLIPDHLSATLIDLSNAKATDMNTLDSYAVDGIKDRELIIEIKAD